MLQSSGSCDTFPPLCLRINTLFLRASQSGDTSRHIFITVTSTIQAPIFLVTCICSISPGENQLFISRLMSNTQLPISYSNLYLQVECPHRQTKRQANSSRLPRLVLSIRKKLQEGAPQVAKARERAGRKMKPVERMRRGRPGLCPKSCKSRSIEDSTQSRLVEHDGIMLSSAPTEDPLLLPSSRSCMLPYPLLQRSPMASHLLV